ncbi:MAG: hypothetical protein JWO37_1875, partial [Acidimicrobiales bacterium]|nr:hypothetical protein [Acidimicrobiales bacterium]
MVGQEAGRGDGDAPPPSAHGPGDDGDPDTAASLSPRSAPPLATAVPSALAEAMVLIVDDEETNVTLLERTLRSSGVARVHGITDPRQVVPRCLDE